MNTITPARRLAEAVHHVTGIDLPPVDDAVFLEPHGLRRLLETALAGTAGLVRVADTLDRRLAFLEDRDGRWVVADLSGQPHRTRAWPAWRSGSIELETPGSWLSPARVDEQAIYRLTRPDELLALCITRSISRCRASRWGSAT